MNVITGSIFACTILSMATYVQAQEYVQTVAPNTTPQAQSPRAGGAPILNAPLLDGKQIEAIARAAEPPKEATQQDRSDLNQIAALLRTGKQDEANSVWIRVAQRHAGSKKEGGKDWIELQSWSSYVLHQAFIKPDPVLSAGAAKVRATPVAHEVAHVTQQPRAARVGDDAQLANVDLQNALQKQQQTLQTMSNISKMLHDTATSVIRKIGS